MNVIKAIRDYINKMVSEPGMKVLLLDEYTTAIVSLVYTQSEILQKEVYLIERVENLTREPMPHLKCVVFARPVPSTIDALCAELKKPKYSTYEMYFSNIIKSGALDRLAEADEHEAVREVQEYYADYYAPNTHVFHLNVNGVLGDAPTMWNRSALELTSQGLLAVLLSLKKKPAIRYQASSDVCQKLAGEITDSMTKEHSLFDFRQGTDVPPLLLILDRRDDPVTPLLNQWTYQAMVNERLHIENNRVNLTKVPSIPKDLREIVMSSEQDEFFHKNMYRNFGEIGNAIRVLVDEFQQRTKSHEHIESIADMKAFIENYPQFRAMSGTVSKHVSVIGELSRLVDVHDLLTVSEVEQELACQKNHSEIVDKMRPLLRSPKVTPEDKLRLVMLYALRYERNSASHLTEFVEVLHDVVPDESLRQLVPAISRYAGAENPARHNDIFGTKGAVGFLKGITSGLKGVENIYTQHTPYLFQILDQLSKLKLKDTSYPFFDKVIRDKPQDVIVFVVGGITFAEAKVVAEFNEANPSMRVLLGGTCVHNFSTFCDEIRKATAR